MAQLDGLPADLDAAAAPVSQIDSASGNLRGKSQSVCGMPAGALETAACLTGERSGDLIGISRNRAKHGVKPGKVVQAASKPADHGFSGQAGKRFVHGSA